jgi:sugar/nucleoside kinase (ribokinase family)
VAECLGRLGLGHDLTFISAVGEDQDKSEIIRNSLKRVGVDTESLYVKPGARTAAFSATLNGKGDFLSGIADMDVLAHIPEAHLQRYQFGKSKILHVDSNISIETLKFILENSASIQHVIYEPISQEKGKRILHGDLLSRVTILKPNI